LNAKVAVDADEIDKNEFRLDVIQGKAFPLTQPEIFVLLMGKGIGKRDLWKAVSQLRRGLGNVRR
jgi:tetrahydromethanopterin S-methyltransferase subunit G